MTYTFESCFAARIEDFIAQKNALGFGYLESSRLLRDFDRFCMTHSRFPGLVGKCAEMQCLYPQPALDGTAVFSGFCWTD